MNLKKLLSLCAPDSEGTFLTYRDARSNMEINALKKLRDKGVFDYLEEDEQYVDYLSSSYIVYVHGEIAQHPDLPYMMTDDTDILCLLLVFDDEGRFIDYSLLYECRELGTYALLYMVR